MTSSPSPALSEPGLPMRLPLRAWLLAGACFLGAYSFMFAVVHVHADTTACLARLPDPLFAIVPRNPAWYFVSHELYYLSTALGTLALIWTAVRGDHRPLARFGMGLGLMAVFRSATITLAPLCKATVEPGVIPHTAIPTLNLGLFRIPWRMWATNDLIFSGHVGEYLLLFWAARGWPVWARASLAVFQVLQAYALIATRGHYTIDIVLAIPFAFLADALSTRILSALTVRAPRLA